ncbi:SMI1/KNR4 family protein [Paenibacillus montanisoli]|uniref:SMI1/KNR4 family protein n=1 Tax=Paenibacillus montanisoli TaxID=2081970 RepID=UPI00140424D7|nr:SMI1/KNR4 family protein [Paenibacillus montanisoli]
MIEIHNQTKTSKESIEAFQNKYRLKLPADYSMFLLDTNGGDPEPNFLEMDKKSELDMIFTSIDSFFGFGLGYDDMFNQFEIHREALPHDSLPICRAAGGNLIVLSLSAEHYGEIFFWDHEIAPEDRAEINDLQFIADSFSEFLDRMQPDTDEADLSGYEIKEVWIHPDFHKLINGD